MVIDLEQVLKLCDRAGLKGRPRQVVELRLQGREEAEIAVELGIAVATVYVHSHNARKKLAAVEPEWTEREFYRFLLEECLRGPRTISRRRGGFHQRPGAARLVAVEDLCGKRSRSRGFAR